MKNYFSVKGLVTWLSTFLTDGFLRKKFKFTCFLIHLISWPIVQSVVWWWNSCLTAVARVKVFVCCSQRYHPCRSREGGPARRKTGKSHLKQDRDGEDRTIRRRTLMLLTQRLRLGGSHHTEDQSLDARESANNERHEFTDSGLID